MGRANLTQEEAVARAAVVDVERYDIEVDLTGMLDGPTLRATSSVRFTATPGASTFVECRAEVERAVLNGDPVPADAIADGRIQLRDLAAENRLEVATSQDGTGEQAGVHRVVDAADGAVYVWMAFEPYDAHRAWACFDQPDLKAPHRFTVTAPGDWRVLSNTAADTVEDDGDGTRRWTFPDTPPLSTYVVTIDAGPFHEIRRETADHSLGIHCPRSRTATFERDTELLLDLTEAGLAFFADRFGTPFPQRHYEQVFVADMPGAFESWGCVTYGEHWVRDTPTHADLARTGEVLLHEMAHQWFGDLVTMRWWDDLWLNEAFASWASVWALEQVDDRFATRWAEFAVERKLRARVQDRGPATHPISTPVPDTASAFASFDMITYAKGQTVLKQLAALVGEDAFLAGLGEYFTTHAWGNATIDDLLDAVGRAAGRDLSGWADAWLRRSGTDTLAVEDGRLHARSPDHLGPRSHRVVVAALGGGEGGLAVRATTSVEVAGSPVALELPGDATILWPDVGDHSFAATRLRPDELSAAVGAVHALPGTMERAQLVAMAHDMMVAGEAGADLVVTVATAVATAEDGPAIVGPSLDLAVAAAESWSAADRREGLVERVATCAADLVADPRLRLVALHVLARTARRDDHLALLDDPHGLGADEAVDLLWRVLARRAQLGDDVDGAVADLAARDDRGDTSAREATVRAGRATRRDKQEVWRQVVEDREIRSPVDIGTIAPAFWRRDQTVLVRPFAERFVALALGLDDEQFWFAATLQRMAPIGVVDEALLAEMDEALGGEALHPSSRQLLTLLADTSRRILMARARASQ